MFGSVVYNDQTTSNAENHGYRIITKTILDMLGVSKIILAMVRYKRFAAIASDRSINTPYSTGMLVRVNYVFM